MAPVYDAIARLLHHYWYYCKLLNNNIVWKFERIFQRSPDISACYIVVSVFSPYLNSVSSFSDAYNHATHVIRGSGCFPDDGEHSPKPSLVKRSISVFGWDADGPLPPFGVRGVLPLGFDMLLENVIIAPLGESAGRLEVVEYSPKVFYSIKCSDFSEMIPPWSLVRSLTRVVVPYSPAIL